MNASHDISRIVRSWIREEEYGSADRVLQIVLSQLDTTPQRRPFWRAWRSPTMNSPVRYAIAGAAVLAVALIGYQFLPRNTGVPGAQLSAPPSATAVTQPSAAPEPSGTGLTRPPNGPVPPGTYLMGTGPTVLVTIPSGWVYNDEELRKHEGEPNEVALFVYRAGVSVFADACQSEGTEEPVGPTAADLIAALQRQKNSEVSDPVDVTLAGLPASRFEVSAPVDLDITECSIGSLQIWVDEGGSYLAGVGLEGSAATILVADSADGRLLLFPEEGDASAADDIAERDAMIASMHVVE